MKQILHRLSYLFVIPIFLIFSVVYSISKFLLNIPYWILTGRSFEAEDVVMKTITNWMDTYYPTFTNTEDEGS